MTYRASDIQGMAKQRFLVYGDIGSGKTSLFRTLPGRKFLYIFDNSGACSIKPTDDIVFDLYLPETISMSVISLRKSGDRLIGDNTVKYSSADTYLHWEEDFEKRISSGWFTDPSVEIDGEPGGFDAIGFDGLTTLSDLIMDRILQINGRAGKFPEQDDWTVQMDTIRRIVRNATSLGLFVYFTGHEEMQQDKMSRSIANQIMLTGKLKKKLPILFSDIYHARAEKDKNGNMSYFVDTTPDSLYPTARCSLELPPSVDVTIPKNCVDPTQFGLGKILREKGIVK